MSKHPQVLFGHRQGSPQQPVAASSPQPDADTTVAVPVQQSPPGSAIVELRAQCLGDIDPALVAKLSPEELTQSVERTLAEIATQRRIQLNGREQRALARELVNDMLGLGPLEPLLEDDSVTDIMVNGPERVFVERSGKLVLSGVRFRDAAHVSHVCQRIAGRIGRRIDESSPMVDARLQDGSRVNIVFPPLALDGPYISIRKFSRNRIDFARLIEFGTMTPPVARVLEMASRARLNVIISGGTGSGKTTLLNALSRLIDIGERIVTIEDAAELQLQQPHVVRLETRAASLEGRGEITQRDLVRNALRMRPDRIIVGEVRGIEAFDMLQAMNTGHDGSMSTIHANTARDALTRIENMVQMGNMGLPSRSILMQIVGAVDLIVQIERQRDGTRRVTQITDVGGMEGDVAILNDIFHFDIEGESLSGKLVGHYTCSRARPSFHERLLYAGVDRSWSAIMDEASK
jgi:pilus assembly protein CpaF